MRVALVAATVLTLVSAQRARADAIDDLAETANVDSDDLRGALNSQPGVDPEMYLQFDGKLAVPESDQAAQSFSVWDRIAACESHGNWAANTGNGFYGGTQTAQQTWLAYGGQQYAPRADFASRAQQIAINNRILAGQGWAAWPFCSRRLGLR